MGGIPTALKERRYATCWTWWRQRREREREKRAQMRREMINKTKGELVYFSGKQTWIVCGEKQ